MKNWLMKAVICLIILVLMTGCASPVEHDQLREEDFMRIEENADVLAAQEKGEFARTYAQFFFQNADSHVTEDYTVESVELIRHVYSFKNKNGENCLALPFSMTVGCKNESGTGTVWNMIILVEPVWEDNQLKVQEYQLNGRFVAFYAEQLYGSCLEAVEGEFTRINSGATVHMYDE